jgi:phospholipase C
MTGFASALGIEHVFVLMLENRSFDHMLGFSGISGMDAETGQVTAVRGLNGTESNSFAGETYRVSPGADFIMPTDPGHEFQNVLHQLCGPAATYKPGGQYPPIDVSGYVASYVGSGGKDPGEIMRCYRPDQLPVLNALAREFVVCDNWHASMPGPTWPNRMFVHAASSGGLDHSPTVLEIAQWEAISGFRFANGTVFDRLQRHGVRRRIYGGDDFPMVAALKGIGVGDIRHYDLFATDLAQARYTDQYVFIEPSYDVFHEYQGGTSQHPRGDVTRGEALIKATYEAIRNSPAWENSLLIITWDEHGGFYDHVHPDGARAPGDTDPGDPHNQNGFTFTQYGPRVPAIVISPRIPKNVVDHRLYDHASISATLAMLFDMNPLTARDANANHLDALITLKAPRDDAPERLPMPANSGTLPTAAAIAGPSTSTERPNETVNSGNVPAIIHAAMQQDIAASPEDRQAIVARVASIRTREEARKYMREVKNKVLPLRSEAARQ